MSNTPGPWSAVTGLTHTDAVIVLNDGHDKADSNSISLRVSCFDAIPKFVANVTLMAAAPELLAALQEVVDQRFIECNCGCVCDGSCTFGIAKAAIKKARGQ